MRSIRRVAGAVALALALIALAVSAFEAYAVWRAGQKTAAILAAWRAKPQPLAPASLSPDQMDILLKVEDPGFRTHHGIDVQSPGQGMTTITQALVKFMYFERFEAGFAKIEQSLIARFVLDPALSKDEQLALFINHARLGMKDGREVRGFAEAAAVHFGKPFPELDRDEYIGLVAMLIGPNEVRPDRPGPYGERVHRIKALLAGKCRPRGVLDATYPDCAAKT